MIEDHPPPIGIEFSSFPTLFSTQDFDRHFHHCRHLMNLFDGAIAFGSVFHAKLEKLSGGQVFVCPLLMGFDAQESEHGSSDKEFDIFVSGNLFNHSKGKTDYLWQISQLPESYKIRLQNSHLTRGRYLELQGKSKFTFTYVQNWGITNSRAFEALSQGCCAFYQSGSELGLLMGNDCGLVPYDETNFADIAAEALDTWQTTHRRDVEKGSKNAFRIYEFETTRRRYSRLLVAHAALINKRQSTPDPRANWRFPNRSPIRIFYNYDGDPGKYLDQQEAFRSNLKTVEGYAARDAIGESFLYSHLFKRQVMQLQLDEQLRLAEAAGPLAKKNLSHLLYGTDHHHSKELDQAETTYRSITEDYPNRLAAWFNLGRLNLEIGQSDQAENLFKHVFSNNDLHYTADDLLFWREFHDRNFDYEEMMFALLDYGQTTDRKHILRIETGIRESALCYWSDILIDEGRSKEALPILVLSMNENTQLHALWFARFKLEALCHNLQAAENCANDFERRRPSLLAIFGSDIIKIADRVGLQIPEVRRKVELFLSRLH
ncbi:MAG: tetratricopeptide repeat protein [Rhodospirillales bacterium]|nr:tetratricopeptide repeat protein [Rhodospirillales bacterium]